MSIPLVLQTPLQSTSSAFDTFCSIRKAEGASPATIANYRNVILPFLRDYPEFLSHPRESILTYISEPENQWTRFTRIKALRVFSKFLIEENLLNADPTKNIKMSLPGKRPDIPNASDVKEVLKSLKLYSFTDRRLRAVILLALDTGLRRGELCGLKQSDIDADLLAVTVKEEYSKVRKSRLVPMSPQVYREIRAFISLIPKEWRTHWLFPANNGDKLSPSNLGLQLWRATNKAGIDLKMHGLRHLCANEFLRGTGNIALTAQMLGHANIKTTSRFYEHLNFDDLQKAHTKANVASSVLGNKRIRKT